jgi:hypothetical protein
MHGLAWLWSLVTKETKTLRNLLEPRDVRRGLNSGPKLLDLEKKNALKSLLNSNTKHILKEAKRKPVPQSAGLEFGRQISSQAKPGVHPIRASS